ncbi:hypothetical protein IPdc08_00616 [archaeon]|nr:hypothetical protein IPdc08_00616 [archaeon]
MKKIGFIFILFVLLLPVNAHAISYKFSNYSMNLEISQTSMINETVSFTMKNIGESPIALVEYFIASKPLSLGIYDSKGPLNYTIENGNTVVISLREPLKNGTSDSIKINFELSGFVADFKEDKILSFSYIPEANITAFSLIVKLPPRSTLASEIEKSGESLSAVYPSPTKIYTNGKRIILEWQRDELKIGESFRVFVMYSNLNKRNYSPLWVLFGLLIGTALTYFVIKGKNKNKNIARMVLSGDEEKIYELILASDGEILQEEIVKTTGFSKAKVSKLIRNLEIKKIIKKEPYRKTNRLMLKKEFGGRF